jgi:hypothetical protein
LPGLRTVAGGNSNFFSGVPELMVLRLLQDREMYGYEIVQAIQSVLKGGGCMCTPFEAFEDRLLTGGIAPRHVKRYLRELGVHLSDIADAMLK